jgi:molecular chaperone DnaK (HSP70)
VTSTPRVVVAIDFGTHGTGFAWTAVSDENDLLSERRISFYENWPGQKINYPKNRSAVLLDANGDFLAWGYQAVAEADKMPKGTGWRLRTGFKMSLRDTSNIATGEAAALAGQAGMVPTADAPDAYRLTVLCLQQVAAIAKDQITRSAYEESDIRWCLTVPAMWDQYTQDLMFKAAVEAGLPDDRDRLLLAQEPAVSALYCAAKGQTLLRTPGTRFMVVDAGGGTIDITSYEVARDGRFDQLTPAVSALTGSDLINVAFVDDVLAGQFGQGIIGRILTSQRAAVAATIDAWERAKRAFSPDDTDDLVIPLSAPFYAALVKEHAAGRWRGAEDPPTEVVIGHETVASLFDRSITKTMDHVERQLAEMRLVSGKGDGELVLLVGGFAESRYLRAKFTERMSRHGAQVIIPEHPSFAVLAGAVHFAYDPAIFITWRAPFTIGIESHMPFEPGIDQEADKVDDFMGRVLCQHRFDIFAANRDAVAIDAPVMRTYRPIYESQSAITLGLAKTDDKKPRYTTEPGVEMIASIRVTLSTDLPVSKRSVEVSMYFAQTHVRVEARNTYTNEPQTVDITWRPTW